MHQAYIPVSLAYAVYQAVDILPLSLCMHVNTLYLLVPAGFSITEADLGCTRLSLNLLGTLRDRFPLVAIAIRHVKGEV